MKLESKIRFAWGGKDLGSQNGSYRPDYLESVPPLAYFLMATLIDDALNLF